MKTSVFICVLLLVTALSTNASRFPPKVDSDLNCQICQLVVAVVEQLIPSGETPDQIVKKLETLCATLPSYKLECKILVDTYGKKIITELINKVPAQNVCKDLTLCPKNMSHYPAALGAVQQSPKQMMVTPFVPLKVKTHKNINVPTGDTKPASVPCEVCKLVMAELEKYLQANATEEQIKKALGQVCAVLPKSIQAICVAFVNTYEQQIIDLLVKQLPPSQVCAGIGLCKKNVTIHNAHNDVTCEVCQFILGEIEKYIQANSTEQQVTAVVEKICTVLPKAYTGVCKAFIDQYSKQIIEALVGKYPPKQVCQQIGLCKKNDRIPVTKAAVVCEVCKYVLGEISKYITENSTESQIVHTVEKICSHLPLTVKNTCDTFIELYGTSIIVILVNKYPADQICALVGVCKQQDEVHILPYPEPKVEAQNPIYCAVCKLVLTEVEKYLSQNATEKQIIQALEKACAALPKSYAPICTAFVDQYGPEVIQLLLNKYPPDQVCHQIGLCPNTTIIYKKVHPIIQKHQKHQKHQKQNTVLCQACEYILTEIDKYLADNATEKEIIAVIEHICNLLPLKVQAVCDAFIEEYGIAIINLLVNKIQPEQICKAIKLCAKNTHIVPLNAKTNNKIPMV
jgi:saposin